MPKWKDLVRERKEIRFNKKSNQWIEETKKEFNKNDKDQEDQNENNVF